MVISVQRSYNGISRSVSFNRWISRSGICSTSRRRSDKGKKSDGFIFDLLLLGLGSRYETLPKSRVKTRVIE